MTRWAVLGASGFVGSAVVAHIRARGDAVTAVAAPRLHTAARSLEALDAELGESESIIAALARDLAGADVVVNAAGIADPGSDVTDSLIGANALLPAVAALAAERAGATRFVHVSSQSAQGLSAVVTEEARWEPFSAYSMSKALGEQLLLYRAFRPGFAVSFRALSVQGPARATTRHLVRLARSGVAMVAHRGPAPLVLIQNTAAAIVYCGAFPGPVPPIVLQPDDGLTTEDALRLLGARRVWAIPRWAGRAGVGLLNAAGRFDARFTGAARRAEVLLFGQRSRSVWFDTHGFSPVAGPSEWAELGAVVAEAGRRPAAIESTDRGGRAGRDTRAKRGELRVTVLTTVHVRSDTRIFEKELPAIAAVPGVRAMALVADGKGPEQRAAYPVVDLGAPPAGRLGRFTISNLRACWYLLQHRPDVVHIHDPELLPLAFVLTLIGVKAIYDAHEDLPSDILAKYWIPKPLRRAIAACVNVLEKGLSRRFSTVIAATPSIERNFPRHRTSCVQNFPMTSEFPSAPSRTEPVGHPAVCYLGAITRIRGLSEVVSALALLPPSSPVRLKLAGPISPPAYRSELAALPGWQRVDYVGVIPRSEVGEFLSTSLAGLVTLHPIKSHMEAQPNKLYEYMAAGVPVIASNFPLWAEIIDTVGCGELVDPLDPAAIAGAIQRLAADPARAHAMGAAGREAIGRSYNWDTESGKLSVIYGNLRDAVRK